ncbi:NAD(P)-binding protein [Neoconidiobolus thromboides FSU 785]|nr:NAD(P)-binding protein [Neoconidiobolus thromboides FSU 785]
MESYYLIIITGVTQGFGQAIFESIIKKYHSSESLKLNFILLGRNKEKLNHLKTNYETKSIEINPIASLEFSDVNSINWENINVKVRETIDSEAFKASKTKKLLFFNNHGTLGDVSKNALELEIAEIQQYLNINLTSFIYLSNLFSKWSQHANFDEKVIINTSSLAATTPMCNSSLYCTIKAARDMFLKVVALEEKKTNIKTLNYAPGPMEGRMQVILRSELKDQELKTVFQNLQKEDKLVKMSDSADKLVQLVHLNEFESGAHIDFFDI